MPGARVHSFHPASSFDRSSFHTSIHTLNPFPVSPYPTLFSICTIAPRWKPSALKNSGMPA